MHSILTIIGLAIVAFALASVVVVVVVMALCRSEKPVAPDYYVLGKEWTFGPVLYSALDIAPLGPSSHIASDSSEQFIGGSAHGKW